MLILLGLLFLKFNTAICQFPDHLDFEKMGQTIHKNEKYNVLRPTIHTVRDYFEDFMQRRETTDFPTKRVFIDKNGFRHFWSDFVDRIHNLRKDGIALEKTLDASAQENSVETVNDFEAKELSDDEDATSETTAKDAIVPESDVTESNIPENEITEGNAAESDIPETVAAEVDITETNNEVPDPPNIIVVTNLADNAQSDVGETTHTASEQTTQESKGESEEIETTTKEHPKRRPKKLYLPMLPPEADNILRADQKERTIAKTSFFCPFFGVVTLQSYLEDENEGEKDEKEDKEIKKDDKKTDKKKA